MRWSCSNLQVASQPSRFFKFESSHCSPFWRTPSPQIAFCLHIASQVMELGGSHCSPIAMSTNPSPHIDALHIPIMQMLPMPHAIPFIAFIPAMHFCPAFPFTITETHASTPLHGFMSGQLSGIFRHENLQFASQPVPAPLPIPKSQSSP